MEFNGLLYVGKRLGKDGRPIYVTKIKTMYDGADHQFELVVDSNGLDSLGKPKDDPRIIPSRRFLRSTHIDEIPQIINLWEGELKLVGIRPRSEKHWRRFPAEHMRRALQHRPGLMGVQYSQPHISSFEELVRLESEYLDRYEINPYRTDMDYLLRILYNKNVNGNRSK